MTTERALASRRLAPVDSRRSSAGLALAALALVVCGGAYGAAAATAAPVAAQAAKEAPASLKKASLVIPSLSFYGMAIIVARDKGYFRDEGIDLEITATGAGPKSAAAILGGSADFGTMEFTDVISALDKKQPLQAFAALCTEPAISIVMKRSIARQKGVGDGSPLADRIMALKGLKIAVTAPGSGTDTSLRWSLRHAGIDPERDVEIVPSRSAANELAAFTQGQVNAFSQVSPWVETAIAKYDGFMVVSFPRGDVPAQRGRMSFALVTSRSVMEKSPDLITAATRAVWRALRLIHERPEEAKALARQTTFGNVDPATYDLAWKINAPAFPETPRISERHVQLNVDFKNAVTGQKSVITFEQAATNRFVEAAARTMRSP